VTAADGYMYERLVMEGLFAKTPSGEKGKSPVTGEPMTHRNIVSNPVVCASKRK